MILCVRALRAELRVSSVQVFILMALMRAVTDDDGDDVHQLLIMTTVMVMVVMMMEAPPRPGFLDAPPGERTRIGTEKQHRPGDTTAWDGGRMASRMAVGRPTHCRLQRRRIPMRWSDGRRSDNVEDRRGMYLHLAVDRPIYHLLALDGEGALVHH